MRPTAAIYMSYRPRINTIFCFVTLWTGLSAVEIPTGTDIPSGFYDVSTTRSENGRIVRDDSMVVISVAENKSLEFRNSDFRGLTVVDGEPKPPPLQYSKNEEFSWLVFGIEVYDWGSWTHIWPKAHIYPLLGLSVQAVAKPYNFWIGAAISNKRIFIDTQELIDTYRDPLRYMPALTAITWGSIIFSQHQWETISNLTWGDVKDIFMDTTISAGATGTIPSLLAPYDFVPIFERTFGDIFGYEWQPPDDNTSIDSATLSRSPSSSSGSSGGSSSTYGQSTSSSSSSRSTTSSSSGVQRPQADSGVSRSPTPSRPSAPSVPSSSPSPLGSSGSYSNPSYSNRGSTVDGLR